MQSREQSGAAAEKRCEDLGRLGVIAGGGGVETGSHWQELGSGIEQRPCSTPLIGVFRLLRSWREVGLWKAVSGVQGQNLKGGRECGWSPGQATGSQSWDGKKQGSPFKMAFSWEGSQRGESFPSPSYDPYPSTPYPLILLSQGKHGIRRAVSGAATPFLLSGSPPLYPLRLHSLRGA